MTRVCCCAAAVGLSAVLSASTGASASPYTFTKIADNAGPISTLANPAINAGGEVVFRAALDAGGTQVIYRGNGGALTAIADNTATSNYLGFGDPVIDGSGTVAFFAGRRFAGGTAIFTVNGTTVGTVAATGSGGLFTSIDSSSLAMNSSGLVSFTGSKSTGAGVYAGVAGGTPATIADVTGPHASFAGFTHVNDAGTVVFQATLDAGAGAGVFSGSGGPVTTIADSSGIWTSTLTAPSINAGGLAAFTAGLDAGGTGLFTGNGGPVSTVATNAGPFASFDTTQGRGPSINASGKIIFRAIPDVGSDGYYDGTNPALHKVIAIGDALDGSTVTSLATLQGRMNDNGQFVFFVVLADGRNAIFRADPVPEPAGAAVVGLLGLCALRRRR